MTDQTTPVPRFSTRPSAPIVIITLFMLAMSACVVGLVAWKALDARSTALSERQSEIPELARSLAEQAHYAIQSIDVALTDLTNLLQYEPPNSEHTNKHLDYLAGTLLQIRGIAVFDATGNCRYSSRPETSCDDFLDLLNYGYHRDNESTELRITGSPQSRIAGQHTITFSKRLNENGRFAGILTATIDDDHLRTIYRSIDVGRGGGITGLSPDGRVLFHASMEDTGPGQFRPDLHHAMSKSAMTGYQKVASPDGATTYIAYAQTPRYPVIIAVAQQEEDMLANWRSQLTSDVVVAAALLASVVLLAAILAWQFRIRLRVEKVLRKREMELKDLNFRLREFANTDGLTGLANRRRLDDYLRREVAEQPAIAVLLLDIDNFKGFNDGLGHQAGDDCLKSVAAVLASATADRVGLSARYGGEEFAVVLPGFDEQDALLVAEAVRRDVAALRIENPASDRGYLTVSIGVAGKTAAVSNEAELLQGADVALYAAKRRGRDRSIARSSLTVSEPGEPADNVPFGNAQNDSVAPALPQIVAAPA